MRFSTFFSNIFEIKFYKFSTLILYRNIMDLLILVHNLKYYKRYLSYYHLFSLNYH